MSSYDIFVKRTSNETTQHRVLLCAESWAKIQAFPEPLSFFLNHRGYVQAFTSSPTFPKRISIHQVIMGYYGNGKRHHYSIDHIDRDRLNNRLSNLRIVNKEDQLKNRKGSLEGTKRRRKISARPLPPSITQEMLKKYVVYYSENLGNGKMREFFQVEGHPKQLKRWIGSKSRKLTILEKLKLANEFADTLEELV